MKTIIILIIIVSALITGCSQQRMAEPAGEISQSTCQNTCDGQALRDKMDATFGFSSYTVQCSECDLSRGGFIKARIIFEGSGRMDLYYHNGWCSSGGADCGWEVSVTSYTRDKFEDVKQRFCGQLKSEGYTGEIPAGGVCGAEKYDSTQDVRQKCLQGEYDSLNSVRASFSVIQEGNRCGYSVKKGEIYTFE